MCTTIESTTRIEGESKIYKEERNALGEEMRKLDECECDMEEFGRLESSEKKMVEIDGGHRRRTRKWIRV